MNPTILQPGVTSLTVPLADAALRGTLHLPTVATALIILAEAGPAPAARNEALATVLQQAGLATLTLDLLTHAEERFRDPHHNVALLVKRLLAGVELIKRHIQLGDLPPLPIGLCAAGDCSPAIVRIAALRDGDIYALVCRDGLIDGAGMLYLRSLKAPLLLLVQPGNEPALASNRRALRELSCVNELKVLPANSDGATRGASLAALAHDAAQWFTRHLPRAKQPAG
ncbi:MAG TPA: hypothetical protein PKA30_10515 [Accumulibacter sp.]|uniref:hypothetical protein n=1 Tax=Accumulibacter sp. TaxID=2053492 RepID=UPI00287983FF|nr:hypothetical protein [Accumulibacter sp.]MDS4055046.1 hypothetical protein [Accumulibacter sp.]HMV05968.1 hypothetical protein [Accumulibacter sp.]HMW80480.1 hypothetical protein [Accumulibacter sp.]HMX68737.1 hypothetical protein [Accumulibacter sp.]HNC27262.1 hypothetical protein [Accumulibacter sp.]